VKEDGQCGHIENAHTGGHTQSGCSGKPVEVADNLPRINQRRAVEADNIHLQLGAVGVLDHGAHHRVLSFHMN